MAIAQQAMVRQHSLPLTQMPPTEISRRPDLLGVPTTRRSVAAGCGVGCKQEARGNDMHQPVHQLLQ